MERHFLQLVQDPGYTNGNANAMPEWNESTTCHLNCRGRGVQKGGAIFLYLIFFASFFDQAKKEEDAAISEAVPKNKYR